MENYREFPYGELRRIPIWRILLWRIMENSLKKIKVFYGQEPPIYYHRMWGQLSTTCSNVLKQSNGELLVAVNHNQLWTMASETVDPIDWSHPQPSWAVPPERHVHSINQCNLSGTRTFKPQHARQPPCLCGHSGYEFSDSLQFSDGELREFPYGEFCRIL